MRGSRKGPRWALAGVFYLGRSKMTSLSFMKIEALIEAENIFKESVIGSNLKFYSYSYIVGSKLPTKNIPSQHEVEQL